MLPHLLSIILPLFIYTALVLVGWGIYHERRKLDRWTVLLAAGAFLASLAFRPNEHLLFFDEDIYIQIASNLSHVPVAQLALLGGPHEVQISTYYKEPAGFPALLSLVFVITGVRETAAFVFARVLYAMAVAVVYLLGREILATRAQAITAAIAFAATPACFAYSASTGTDLAAALFAALGVWGIMSGNGMLTAGAFAMAAQIRLEMIVLVPLIFLADRVSLKWKAALAIMVVPEILHISWVLSIAPALARVEHVNSAFSATYVVQNLMANIKYLFDPRAFPIVVAIGAIAGTIVSLPQYRRVLLAWPTCLFLVYLAFYAGSFDVNPRYSIQITIPLILLAVSVSNHRPVLGLIVLSAVVPSLRPWQLPTYVQALASDHQTAVQFAQKVGPDDLVISSEPEVFINQGKHAMNAVFATDQPLRLKEQLTKYRKVFYYGGIRTNQVGTEQWEADRKVKSEFELHLVDAREFSGFRIAVYELLNLVHREAG